MAAGGLWWVDDLCWCWLVLWGVGGALIVCGRVAAGCSSGACPSGAGWASRWWEAVWMFGVVCGARAVRVIVEHVGVAVPLV